MDKNVFGADVKFKNEYMQQIKNNNSLSTYTNTFRTLKDAKKFEDRYGKDVYDFDKKQIEEMLKSFKIRTKNSFKQRLSTYSQYIDSAVEKGLAKENNANKLDPRKYMTLIDVNAYDNRYITRDDLFDAMTELINAQDQIVLALLFDGVMGKNYENLVNLKKRDIDKEKKVAKLYDGTTVNISKDTYNLIQLAVEETDYYTYSESQIVYPLPDNEYVVRVPKRPSGSQLDPVKQSSIRVKIDQFKKLIEEKYLTGRSIYISGAADRFIAEFGENYTIEQLEKWLINNDIKTNPQEMKNVVNLLIQKGA